MHFRTSFTVALVQKIAIPLFHSHREKAGIHAKISAPSYKYVASPRFFLGTGDAGRGPAATQTPGFPTSTLPKTGGPPPIPLPSPPPPFSYDT